MIKYNFYWLVKVLRHTKGWKNSRIYYRIDFEQYTCLYVDLYIIFFIHFNFVYFEIKMDQLNRVEALDMQHKTLWIDSYRNTVSIDKLMVEIFYICFHVAIFTANI